MNPYTDIIRGPRYEPLSAAEEKLLAEKIRTNDHERESRNRLVCGNLRFAVKVAIQYQGAGLSLEDLIQEANRGLIDAAGRFDGNKNFKFISYAIWWIRRYILVAINTSGRITALPHTGSIGTRIKYAVDSLEQKLGREPTRAEIAEALGISEQWVNTIMNTNQNISLNECGDNSETEMLDSLTYEDQEISIDEDLLSAEIDKLNQRERDVIRTYFMSGYNCNLDDIAASKGLSRERVRQIKADGIKKLKKNLKPSEVYV